MTKFKHFFLSLTLFSTLGLSLSPSTSLAAGPDANRQTITVQLNRAGGTASVGGTVVPLELITFTAQIPGRVEFIAGKEGDFFKRGEVLAGLQEDELRAQRQAALAQIQNAESTVRDARVQYSRERKSPTSKNMMDQFMPGIPMSSFMGGDKKVDRRATLHSYGTQVEQARGGVLQAQSRLREIDAKLRDARSIAPFDGYITRKHVNIGDTINPGQPLLNFANMSVLHVQADVPARLVDILQTQSQVTVRLDDANKTLVDSRVAQIFPMADTTRHTVRVKFSLPQNAPARAGMYAEVLIPQPGQHSRPFPIIPLSAVVYRGGLPMVYVIGPDQQPRLNLLRLGEQLPGGHVVVLTGLKGGEQLLVNP